MNKPLQRMQRFRMNQFVIGSWPFHAEYDQAFCRQYKAAGFNVLVDAPKILDEAHNAGLKVILNTQLKLVRDEKGRAIPGKYTMGPYAHLGELKELHGLFGRHPALAGYLLNDNCQLHDYTIECAEWLRRNAPGMFPYMSHNPDPAGQAKVVESMPILSSQNYPFGYHNDWPEPKKRREFCNGLEADRAAANAGDLAVWPIFAVYGQPNLGASQIRFQAFSSIAYGAQGIFYFAYSSKRPVWRDSGMVRAAVTYCNDYVAPSVGPRVLGCRSIGVYHTALADDLPKGALLPKGGELIERMDEGLLAGILVAEKDFKAGRRLPAYVMVVDKRTAGEGQPEPSPREVSLTFAPAVGTIEIVGAGPERPGKIAGRTATVTLKPGDGVLLRIAPAGAK